MLSRFFAVLALSLFFGQVSAEEIFDRPDLASGKFYLTCVYSDPLDAKSVDLQSWVRSDDGLAHLKSQCVFNEFLESTALIKNTQWSRFLGNDYPVLLLQSSHASDSTANVVFFVKGANLAVGEELKRDIDHAIKQYASRSGLNEQIFPRLRPRRPVCPGPDCPNPRQPVQPEPAPIPETVPTPEVAPIPETVPSVAPEDSDEDGGFPLWMLLVPVVAGGAGAYFQLKKD